MGDISFMLLIALSLALIPLIPLSVCRFKYCEWNKRFCVLNNVIIRQHDMIGDYNFECASKTFVLFKSDNITLMNELKNTTFFENSIVDCYMKQKMGGHYITIEPFSDQEKVNMLAATISIAILWFFTVIYNFYGDELGKFFKK